MKKQYIAPTTLSVNISVENHILASSEIHIDTEGSTDKFDAPSSREFGNLWGNKGW